MAKTETHPDDEVPREGLSYEPGDDFADMAPELDLDATGWLPKVGDRLFGHVIAVDEATSTFNGSTYPIVFVLAPDGREVAVHCFHTVLKSEIERKRPAAGDRIAIVYRGQTGEAKPGQDAPHMYRVVVKPAVGSDEDRF